MLSVDVRSRRDLHAMVVGLSLVDREFQKAFQIHARRRIEPLWKQELEASRPNRLQRHVLVSTARVSVSAKSIRLKSGSIGKLAKGDSNAEVARAVEFGQNPSFRSRYKRRNERGGGTHTVTRRTAIPVGPRRPDGKVVYPALERFVPKATEVAFEAFVEVVEDALSM